MPTIMEIDSRFSVSWIDTDTGMMESRFFTDYASAEICFQFVNNSIGNE